MSAPTVFLVLGMHRSGSSVAAGLLHHWGICCGDTNHLLPVQEDNPSGFWESRALVEFNEKLLLACHASWLNPPPLEYDFHGSGIIAQLGAEGASLVTDMDTCGGPWFWKDPRLACLMGFWEHLLRDRSVAVVVPVRNPLDIGASLWKRDRIPVSSALLIWQRSILDILRFVTSNKVPALFVDFDSLFDFPERECQRLETFIEERSGMATGPESIKKMTGSIEGKLRHNQTVQQNGLLCDQHGFLQKQLLHLCQKDHTATKEILAEVPMDQIALPESWAVELDLLRHVIEQRNQIGALQERLESLNHQLGEHQLEFVRLGRQSAEHEDKIHYLMRSWTNRFVSFINRYIPRGTRG